MFRNLVLLSALLFSSRSETFTMRYSDGSRERYRVRFAGRFLAGGATGTLRARMQFHKGKAHYTPCDSGVQTWEARP